MRATSIEGSLAGSLGTALAVLWIALAPGTPAAKAAEPFCVHLKEELAGKPFVAKVPLYDTEIGYDMIYHLERDGEEIPKGQELTVVDVECNKKTVEMTLKPLPKGDKVEIKFFLSRAERVRLDEGREHLAHMMKFVFVSDEDEEAEEGSP